jgi:molybdenum cofactor biosynthesis enzyme
MVKFKDYAFFVPKDASGRTAIVEGTMTMKQETVEQTKHYLEDAGKTDEAAKVTEGRKLYHFMASGVAMTRPAGDSAPNTYEQFGAGVTGATPLAEVLKNPAAFTGKTVRIEAPITAVCQTKGCWMHLGSQQPPVMVKFKDYAFFVPKDASGRTAIVEGTMTMKQETVEQTKHYLEDAGKADEAAKVTEGRKLYHFMASGVAIRKPAK